MKQIDPLSNRPLIEYCPKCGSKNCREQTWRLEGDFHITLGHCNTCNHTFAPKRGACNDCPNRGSGLNQSRTERGSGLNQSRPVRGSELNQSRTERKTPA